VERCIAVAEATRRLPGGEEVTVDGPHLKTAGAKLSDPRPVRERVPLLVGGGNPGLLKWARGNADLMSYAGMLDLLAPLIHRLSD
jgi:alkanesulfonate monooxygenase SsuD/methylene tetrahydromethanopterin reductase-like flavin-dependent oxidoreductase (luciferase family)